MLKESIWNENFSLCFIFLVISIEYKGAIRSSIWFAFRLSITTTTTSTHTTHLGWVGNFFFLFLSFLLLFFFLLHCNFILLILCGPFLCECSSFIFKLIMRIIIIIIIIVLVVVLFHWELRTDLVCSRNWKKLLIFFPLRSLPFWFSSTLSHLVLFDLSCWWSDRTITIILMVNIETWLWFRAILSDSLSLSLSGSASVHLTTKH